jgi:copper chaperone NosL
MTRLAALAAAFLAILAACASGPPRPATLVPGQEICAYCRMTVSEPRFASQIVASGEEALFFDDHGCLRDFLRAGRAPEGGVAFVADHRTLQWVEAGRAVYTRVPGLHTPMGSGLIAHADAASRDADPVAKRGTALSAADVFGATLPAGGAR